jgi:hypothetical protein
MLGENRIHLIGIGDIRTIEFVPLAHFFGDAGEVGRIARVSQRIDIRDQSRTVMLKHKSDEIAANEAAAASDE